MVHVSKIDKNRLLESFEVRSMHEGLAARLCCDRATRAELRVLGEMVEQMFKLGKAKKWDEMSLLDRQFHSRIIELSGNSMLVRLAHNYRVLGKFVRANRDPKIIRDEHMSILKAIELKQDGDHLRLIVKVSNKQLEKLAETMEKFGGMGLGGSRRRSKAADFDF